MASVCHPPPGSVQLRATMRAMRCRACDERISTGAIHCAECGTLVDEPPPHGDDVGLGGTAVQEAIGLPPTVNAGTEQRLPDNPDEYPALPENADGYRSLLRERFGFHEFRDGQSATLEALSTGDVLAVMPTGAGKSLCYVLPALVTGHVVVVSPLIALMQDQVEHLRSADVPATFINSTVPRAERVRRERDFASGRAALLYVAPERLADAHFTERLRAAGVALLAIDEAHCISEWGHDFRPDYLTLGAVRERLGSPRTLALTATADAMVRDDIAIRLGIDDARRVVTGFDRPNLQLGGTRIDGASERIEWLVSYVHERPDRTGIVYARTRRSTEETAAALQDRGIDAAPYHAGMDAATRADTQRRFIAGELAIISCTNAFGMGIDKPDVRFVVHLGMPGRLESYYQEAGRAGRDGDHAECMLVHSARDAGLQRRFIKQAYPDASQVRAVWENLVRTDEARGGAPLSPETGRNEAEDGWAATLAALRASGLIERDTLRLKSLDPAARIDISGITERRRYAEVRLGQMIEYAESQGCRRQLVLRYFGDEPPEGGCGNCDRCGAGDTVPDAGYPAEMFTKLLTLRDDIAHETGRPPYMVFEERTARETATIRPRNADELQRVWGMGDRRIRWFGARMTAIVRAWELANPEAPEPAERARVVTAPPPPPRKRQERTRGDAAPDPGERARNAAAGHNRLKEREQRERADAARATASRLAEVPFDDPLFERIREWRRARARLDGVPAYTLFTDRSARELAHSRPSSRAELAEIWGFGDARIGLIGDEILALIQSCGPNAEEPTGTAQTSS